MIGPRARRCHEVPELTENVETWWDGVRCQARRCLVEVLHPAPGVPLPPRVWYVGLIGEMRWAIEVTLPETEDPRMRFGKPVGERVYIDDENGWGWRMVTAMRGRKAIPVGRYHRVRVVEYWPE